jgi:hypothetical protein
VLSGYESCEFGACGAGPSSFGPGTGAALDPNNKFQYTVGSIAELLGFGMAYANWGDPNERLFGTHYCGPGGGGSEVNGLDRFCHIHDLCYNQFNVNAAANFPHSGITLSPAQVAGIQGCNQALANGAKGLMGRVTGADYVYYWMRGNFGFIYPGTAAH